MIDTHSHIFSEEFDEDRQRVVTEAIDVGVRNVILANVDSSTIDRLDNPWNLIAFQGRNYTDSAPLAVTPRPDSVLRVFMAYRPMAAPIVVPPQELTPFVRRGFTFVEWGGQRPDERVR